MLEMLATLNLAVLALSAEGAHRSLSLLPSFASSVESHSVVQGAGQADEAEELSRIHGTKA